MSNELIIKDLHISVQGNEIIKGLDITVKPGEVHALMGPNGSGEKHTRLRFDGTPLLRN